MVGRGQLRDPGGTPEKGGASPGVQPRKGIRNNQLIVMVFTAVGIIPGLYFSYTSFTPSPKKCVRTGLRATTWNIAAVNNNPFEYWVTHPDPAYNKLMADVQAFIDAPSEEGDAEVGSIVTDGMVEELLGLMGKAGVSEDMLKEVRRRWEEEYKGRRAVSGFVKDKLIGSKRLASMPDRITNTINVEGGGTALRPTVVNCFSGEMGDVQSWWGAWKSFMFEEHVALVGEEDGKVPFSMLMGIKHAKYPAISPEEERISIPLQTLALAIFDATLTHMMNSVGKGAWQGLRQQLCASLNLKKDANILSILESQYLDSDVVFLQETSKAFAKAAEASPLASKFFLSKPAKMDAKRDQNSVILLDASTFVKGSAVDVTERVLASVNGSVAAPGDLYVVSIRTTAPKSRRMLLASFHGDTNGLATKPIVEGVDRAYRAHFLDHDLLMGLDANTYKKHDAHWQGVEDFGEFLGERGMGSCWGGRPDKLRPTTCNARTYLQPQLNKAVRIQDKLTKGDVNLKDWIIFYTSQVAAANATRDNTGKTSYVEEMVFPTLDFPSDHAAVSSHVTVGRC